MENSYLLTPNFEDQSPDLISKLPNVCFQAFQRPSPDIELTLLVYEAHYPHVLQVEASNPASLYPFVIAGDIKRQIHHIIRRIVTIHHERHRLDFTGQHYAMVAKYLIHNYLCVRYVFGVRSLHFRH